MIKEYDIYKKIFINFILIQIIILSYIKYHSNYYSNNKQILLSAYISNNQGYRPKILNFDKIWKGYKFWMVYSLYFNGDATKENPIINSSNDLIHWINPKGIKNPLDIPKISEKNHFNSDTYLLFNKNTNELELFWRYVNYQDNEVTIFIKKSKDGIKWSEKEIFLKSNDQKKQDYVSPSIIIENKVYKIWYVHRKKIFYFQYNGKNFTTSRIVDIYFENEYHIRGIDIIFNEKKKIYELIICAYIDKNKKNEMSLFYTSSEDNIFWNFPKKILETPKKKLKFDFEDLYQSSLIYLNNKYYLFYSFYNIKRNVGIGLIYGPNITNLKPFL